MIPLFGCGGRMKVWAYFITFLWLVFNTGCVRQHSNVAATTTAEAPPVCDRQLEICLKEVMRLPPVPGSFEEADVGVGPRASEIEILALTTSLSIAADAKRYSLLIDHQRQVLFVATSGGISDQLHENFGPWSLDAPASQRLIRLARQRE